MADILPPIPIDSPFGSSNWTDWYKKVRDAINNSTNIPWTSITGKPTTIAGYGITNGLEILAGKITAITPVNNGAAGLAGTLLNSPLVGNPTKWIPFDDNGTVRYIPSW